jgi:hypothetical protein
MTIDFANETTMTRPRKDIVNFMILDTLQKTLEAYQTWEELNDSQTRIRELKSRLLQLTTLIISPLNKQLQTEKPKRTITQFRTQIKDAQQEELYPLLDYLQQFLYDKDVTKWDTKEQWDRTNILESNRRTHGTD